MSQGDVPRSCWDGEPSHKKDSAWAWIVCLGVAMNLAFTLGLIFSFGVLLPVFMEYFKESRENTAWIGSLSISLMLFVGPLSSSLVNRFGCRAVSITGCLTCAFSLTIASFANNLIILYVTYSVLGAGTSCVFVSGLEMVRKSFDRRRSIAVGVVSTGQGLGTMVLSQVPQSLVSALSWRNALRIVAGALFLNSFFGLLYDSKTAATSDNRDQEEGERRRTSKRFSFHCSVWKVPNFIVLISTSFVVMFGRSSIYVHLVKNSEDHGMSSDASSRLFLFLGINTVLGRLVCGFLCSLKRLDNWYILQSVLLVNGISTILLTLAENYAAFAAYSVVFGFCDGAMATVFNLLALTCVDHSRAASAFGYNLLVASVTSMIGPPLSGYTAEKLGSYGPAFHMAGGAYVLASLTPCVLHCVKVSDAKIMKTTVER